MSAPIPMTAAQSNRLLAFAIPLLFLLAILVYWPGLKGPFLFDDNVHIVKNSQVHIEDLSGKSLLRAWHSSLASFPADRPLAQLSFGINHAVSGLSSFAFKATNLAIHLLNGCLIFLLSLRLVELLPPSSAKHHNLAWLPLLTTALWLLHPLNFTPVLYVVQRMALLSALFVLLGLLLYIRGRVRLADGQKSGLWLILMSLPVALLGILAKESAALFPLLVLSLELTLLRRLPNPSPGHLRWVQGLVIALPLALGVVYFLTHTGLASYDNRTFSLVDRLLTEARAFWFYWQQLFIPNLDRFGLNHDDFILSRGWTTPATTLPATIGVALLLAWALAACRKYPVLSFGVLFFLAAHALESTVIPLEPIFEHRNYVASYAPLFALAWALTVAASAPGRAWWMVLILTVLVSYASLTYLRAREWSSMESYIISEVEHHPASARANFNAAKMLIRTPAEGEDASASYQSARFYLERTRKLDHEHLDSLFGLIVLNLHHGLDPEPQWLVDLNEGLRHGVVDATKITTAQFSFLVRWHMAADTHKLPPEVVIGLFESALANPKNDRYGRSGILSALRAYYDLVLNDPEKALPYAREAARVWPQRWHYQKRHLELLVKLGRLDEADKVLQTARQFDPEGLHADDAERLSKLIAATAKETIDE